MIKRELAKDPKLAGESWDRFLPKFRKRHLKTSEKTARKNEVLEAKTEARKAAGLETGEQPKKKVYTPFPPPQQPRKVDLQLESGEYFLKPREKEAKETQRRKEKVCTFRLTYGLYHLTSICLASRSHCGTTSKTRRSLRRARGDSRADCGGEAQEKEEKRTDRRRRRRRTFGKKGEK